MLARISLRTRPVAAGDRDHVDEVRGARAGEQLLVDPRGREESEPDYPHDGSVIGRKAVSRTRWLRGRVSTNRTTSATSSALIIPVSSGMSGVRPRGTDGVDRALDVDVDHLLEMVEIELEERPVRAHPRVRDEDVEPAEPVDGSA